MADHVSLDAQGLGSALAILQREQASCVPTERERTLYRWFNICVYATAVEFAFLFAIGVMGEGTDAYPITFGLLSVAALAFMLATIVLFFLNTSLIRKLYHHAQLRKRLKLADYFAGAFSAAGKTKVIGNVVTIVTTIVGWLLILAAFFGGVAVVVGLFERRVEAIVSGTIYLATFLVGVSFISFRYVRRGKQRLEVVLRLQKTLTEQAPQGGSADAAVRLSTEDYDAIATLERQHIIRDRASIIASARRQTDSPEYLCQSSRQMQLAKSRLPTDLLVKVENVIAALLVDPLSAAATSDPRTGQRTIQVSDTGFRIQYDVDMGRHLVRLYDLQTELGTSLSAAGGADGVS